MATIRAYTTIEQSKKLSKILPKESADMGWYYTRNPQAARNQMWLGTKPENADIPCWSLAALLKLIPKRILRKDKIHCGQAFIPSFRWEITPTAIFYTDGNNIMDYVSFRYGENNIELIDAVFKMVVWLKENSRL